MADQPSAFDKTMATVAQLTASAEALAALSTWLRVGEEGLRIDPDLVGSLEGVAKALGIDKDQLSAVERATAAQYASAFLRQAVDLVEHPGRPTGWGYDEEMILLTLGRASAVIARLIAQVSPSLPGLAAALAADGARFLDVGAGVCALSIGLARVWPNLTVVGLEPWGPSRTLAEREIVTAELDDRVHVRDERVEQLDEVDTYDAAFIAGPFIPTEVVPAALHRVRTALKPGGWVFFGTYAGPPDPLAQMLVDLRTVRSGGSAAPQAEIAGWLVEAGYAEVQVVERTWQAPARFVVGRA
jgi:SAM-dependent methyltransferase